MGGIDWKVVSLFWQFIAARLHGASPRQLPALQLLIAHRSKDPYAVRELLMQALGHLNELLTHAELEHRQHAVDAWPSPAAPAGSSPDDVLP